MHNSRKYVSNLINSIKQIQTRSNDLKEELVRIEGADKYQGVESYYKKILEKLTKEMHELPIGHRYTGTFYIKKAYSMPTGYEKIDGSAFMKEDLVSWTIENNEDYRYMYHRAIFKEPNDKSIINREKCEPIYE